MSSNAPPLPPVRFDNNEVVIELRSGLPSGTVTFLMTDIEDSTLLWHERPDEMPGAVSRHYEILDAAIGAHDGVRPEEQGEGDSVVAAFASPAAALGAAIDAQRMFAAELGWVRVRMAVHTGQAVLRDERNYVGRGIIRAARLRDCGHGGQVLVSETTSALVTDLLPEQMSLSELGEVELRGLGRTERVWQLNHPDLRATFPALRSLRGPRHNLPVALTALVGREPELIAIGELVAAERLVTLTGPGGAGKTRLALAAAGAVLGDNPGGVWWIELAPMSSTDQVGERVATMLGVLASNGVDPVAQLVERLRDGRRALIVLDNAEHLIDAAAEFTRAVLVGCPQVRVLVTSREPLGVPGETIWRVPPLSFPPSGSTVTVVSAGEFDAVRLFLERARRARPNLVVDDATIGHIVEICSRLDGIPLAIELAAARARTLPLDRLAAGLSDAFRLLTGGARTVLARQQTLLASIAWSVDTLDAVERAVFRRLAVFHAPFTIDAAEVVCADGEIVDSYAVLDTIARLVDKSLVQFDDASDRYQVLETVRQYGFDRLREHQELVDTRNRHAEWFARWCEDIARGGHGLQEHRFAVDLPDLRAALDWSYDQTPAHAYRIAGGLVGFLTMLGPAACTRVYDWVLERDGNDDPTGWARAVASLTMDALAMDRLEVAAFVALAMTRLEPDDPAMLRLQLFVALPEAMAGRLETWRAIAVAALAAGDDALAVGLLGALSFIGGRCGRLDEAQHDLRKLEHLLARHELPFDADTARMGYTAAIDQAIIQGRLADARTIIERATLPTVDATAAAAVCHAHLGLITDNGPMVSATLEWIRYEPAPRQRPLHSYTRAFAAFHAHDLAAAADHGMAGWVGNETSEVMQGVYAPLVAAILVAAGRHPDAEAFADAWNVKARELGEHPLHLASARHATAIVALAADRTDRALEHAHDLLEIAERYGFVLFQIDALHILVAVAATRSNATTAARLAGAVSAASLRIGYTHPVAADPNAPGALARHFAKIEPEAFNAGVALELADACEFARRSRGDRHRPTFGWASLTPTETRVAELAAQGFTNQSIGRTLLMSPATVKTHLSHTFTKLAVRNRTELAAQHRAAGG